MKWVVVILIVVLIPGLIWLAQVGWGWTPEPVVDHLAVTVAVLGGVAVVAAIYELARGRAPRKTALIGLTLGLLLLADTVVDLTLGATRVSIGLGAAMLGIVWYGYRSTGSDERQET